MDDKNSTQKREPSSKKYIPPHKRPGVTTSPYNISSSSRRRFFNPTNGQSSTSDANRITSEKQYHRSQAHLNIAVLSKPENLAQQHADLPNVRMPLLDKKFAPVSIAWTT